MCASGGTWQNATYDDYNYQYRWTKTWQGQGDGAVTSSASNHVTGLENGSENGWWTHTMPEGSGSGSSSSTSWGGPWDDSYDTTVSYPGFSEGRYYGWDYGGSGEEDYIAYVSDAFTDGSSPGSGSSSGGMFPSAYDDAVYLIAGSKLGTGEFDGVNIRTHTDPVRSQRSAFLRATVEPGDRSGGTSQSSLKETPRCRTTQIREHESQPYGQSLRTQATGSEQGTAGQANGPGLWDLGREFFGLYAYYFNQNLDYYQAGLDAAGCIPGAGEPFDALNAGISAARGDWTGAGLSAASMIPMWGDAVGKAGKLGRYAAKYGDEATEAAKRGLKGAAELRPYGGPGGGHHIPARKVFEGAPATMPRKPWRYQTR